MQATDATRAMRQVSASLLAYAFMPRKMHCLKQGESEYVEVLYSIAIRKRRPISTRSIILIAFAQLSVFDLQC